jgi:hypothetical protein
MESRSESDDCNLLELKIYREIALGLLALSCNDDLVPARIDFDRSFIGAVSKDISSLPDYGSERGFFVVIKNPVATSWEGRCASWSAQITNKFTRAFFKQTDG